MLSLYVTDGHVHYGRFPLLVEAIVTGATCGRVF
jgi:hypothetical protein